MNAAKRIRKFLVQNPSHPSSSILSRLVVSIGEESAISLDDMYALNYETFGYVLDLLKEWRLDRYNVSKLRLLDTVLDSHLEAPDGRNGSEERGGEKGASTNGGSAEHGTTPHLPPLPRN
jgi:hypothetical protein